MSTELVAIERITIRKGDSNADDIRSCLAHYLLQFINSASIESLSMHKLSIKVDGKTVLFVQDKTGGVGLKGLDTDWQHTPEMSANASGSTSKMVAGCATICRLPNPCTTILRCCLSSFLSR